MTSTQLAPYYTLAAPDRTVSMYHAMKAMSCWRAVTVEGDMILGVWSADGSAWMWQAQTGYQQMLRGGKLDKWKTKRRTVIWTT